MVGLGFGIDTPNLRFRIGLGFGDGEFYWTPGLIESGSSTPGTFFDAMSDQYWKYSWLCFRLFIAKAGK